MSEKDVQFVLIDDDVDEHYLLKSDFMRHAPLAELQCFDSWSAFERFMKDCNYIFKKKMVMLLDLNMPEVSGYEIIARIRADARFKSLPIIVYSTSNAEQDVQRGYVLGANSFVSKPTDRKQAEQLTTDLVKYWSSCVQLPSQDVHLHQNGDDVSIQGRP